MIKSIFIIVILFSINTAQTNISFNDSIDSISNYISGLNNFSGDEVDLIDSIYIKAKFFNNNDIGETLFSLSFALLPYKRVSMKIPFISINFDVNFPSQPDSIYQKKIANLPSHFLADSPLNKFGDKDKLSHFFGNAFLTFKLDMLNLPLFFSVFIELFEEAFIDKAEIDKRDFMVNRIGAEFGRLLNKKPDSLPSEILRFYK